MTGSQDRGARRVPWAVALHPLWAALTGSAAARGPGTAAGPMGRSDHSSMERGPRGRQVAIGPEETAVVGRGPGLGVQESRVGTVLLVGLWQLLRLPTTTNLTSTPGGGACPVPKPAASQQAQECLGGHCPPDLAVHSHRPLRVSLWSGSRELHRAAAGTGPWSQPRKALSLPGREREVSPGEGGRRGERGHPPAGRVLQNAFASVFLWSVRPFCSLLCLYMIDN